jgi:MoaD family protein
MAKTAPVTIYVPTVLRVRCGNAAQLSVTAADVRGVLEELERRHPDLYASICDETGKVRRHVNLFVNKDNIRDGQGLDTGLSSGDVVTILPAVSGG